MLQPTGERSRPKGRGRQTRRRILEAAYRLMSSRGYSQTTIADVAAAAGVAVPTVYFNFRTKPALFAEVVGLAVKGDEDVEPTNQTWLTELRKEPEVRHAVAGVVEAMTRILKRTTPLWAALHGLSEDPELADFHRYSEGLRQDGYRTLINLLHEKFPLRDDLSPDVAVAILMVMLGPDVYRAFVHEHGWSVERWQRWTTDMLVTTLFKFR